AHRHRRALRPDFQVAQVVPSSSLAPRLAPPSPLGGRPGHLPRPNLPGADPWVGLKQHEPSAPASGRSRPAAGGDPTPSRRDPYQGFPNGADRSPPPTPLSAYGSAGDSRASARTACRATLDLDPSTHRLQTLQFDESDGSPTGCLGSYPPRSHAPRPT